MRHSQDTQHALVLDEQLVASLQPYGGAELLSCTVIRTDRPRQEIGWAMNAFSILRFRREPPPDNPLLVFITAKPEKFASSKHQLMITRSDLSHSEALQVLTYENHYPNPRVSTSTPPIEAPGIWIGPEIVGREEHRARDLSGVRDSFTLFERWRTGKELEDEIGGDGVDWLCNRLKALTAVDLHARRERLGNFMVVMPQIRHRMRVWWPRKTKLGIEVRAVDGGPSSFLLMVRASRHGALVASHYRKIESGFHIFDVPEFIDHREIELYDATSGAIIDRDAGTPLRSLHLTSHAITTSLDLTFNFSDGSPSINTKTKWGIIHRSEVGDTRAQWEIELADVRERERRERLREDKTIFVYRGGPTDRQQAVSDIKQIISNSNARYLKIWDPYFGVREAAEFLLCVSDPLIPISVLTSLEKFPGENKHQEHRHRPYPRSANEKKGARRERLQHKYRLRRAGRIDIYTNKKIPSPIRDRKKEQLRKVLQMLRNPAPGISGLTALACRVGAEMFHDRFIITDNDCWQLGCSFNQIGKVMSTITKFPHPALIEREFDRSWQKIKEEL